jgi:hypothetical protein
MTEDEACELLVTQKAYWMYGMGWQIVTEPGPYGNVTRFATAEESTLLDKVKATVIGQPDSTERRERLTDGTVAYWGDYE